MQETNPITEAASLSGIIAEEKTIPYRSSSLFRHRAVVQLNRHLYSMRCIPHKC